MSVSTQMSIRDRMSSALNKIEQRTRKVNTALSTMDTLTRTASPAEAYERAAESAGGAADQVDRFRQKQDRVENGAERVNSLWSMIGGYVRAAGAALGLSKLTSLSDTITGINARMSLITKEGDNVADVNREIFDSAMRARAAYTDTAAAVSKLGLLAGKAFGSTDEITAFTELMNKNFVIGGASQTEQASAMYQLTQAMASGRLQGDEYRSIIENAPLLANAIEDYMINVQKARGTMKDWASDGLLTADVIKAALFSSADQVEERFAKMPMTWGQVWTMAGNIAIRALNPLLSLINWLANNIEIIGPLVLGIGTAFLVFQAAAHWTQIAAAATGAYHFVVNLLSIGFGVLTGNTAAASAAVFTFNSTLLASPVTWAVMGIALLVAALYAGVAAYNKLTGASVSATGILCAGAAMAGAFLLNTFVGVMNAILQATYSIFVEPFLGIIEWVLNAANGGFTSFGGAVANLIGQITSWFLSLGKVVTTIIDSIFGTNWTSGLSALQDKVLQWGKSETAITLDRTAPKLDGRIAYGDARKAGYSFGEGIANKVSSALGFGGAGNMDLSAIQNGISDISANTGKMANEVNIADEDLKFLRDVAEMRFVQNFVTLTPTVAMTASISEKVDVNTVVSAIEQKLEEEFASSAEGVYA